MDGNWAGTTYTQQMVDSGKYEGNEYLLSIMFGSNLSEERKLASQIKNELDTTIKSFVRRSNDKYGEMLQKYLNDIKKNSMKLSKLHAKGKPNKGSFVKLVSYEKESDAINNVISALIYEQSPSIEFSHLQKNVRKIQLCRPHVQTYNIFLTHVLSTRIFSQGMPMLRSKFRLKIYLPLPN